MSAGRAEARSAPAATRVARPGRLGRRRAGRDHHQY
jgi:hypothetical protein